MKNSDETLEPRTPHGWKKCEICGAVVIQMMMARFQGQKLVGWSCLHHHKGNQS